MANLLNKNKLVMVKGKVCIRSKKRCSRQKFSPEEDEKLKELASKMNTWEDIAKEMPGRNGRQCRDRYKNYLNSCYFNGQWTVEEDRILLDKYKEFGPRWSKIQTFFQNRSSNSLKNRWNYYISKHLIKSTDCFNIKVEEKMIDDHKDEYDFFDFEDQIDDEFFNFNCEDFY